MSNIILTHLENAKANLEAEKQRQIAIIKERVIREMQPKYVEIEKMKNDALNQASIDHNSSRNTATEQYNAQLIALQNKFENDKQAIVEGAEKKKAEMLDVALVSETHETKNKFEKAIAKLDAQIKELKE